MSEAAVRAYAQEKHFSAATLERWLDRPEAEREILLQMVQRLRLGENQFRDIIDQLEDVAARQRSTLVAVVGSAPIRETLERGLGRNETIRMLKHHLRRLRYPQLASAEQRLAELAKHLRFPTGVRIDFPEHLEGEYLTVTVRARSVAELQAQAASLTSAAHRTELEEMFSVLEGNW